MSKNHLETIDPTALAQVSGGTRTASSSSSSDDQLLTALSGVADSLKNLSQPHSGFSSEEMMLFMVMMMNNRNSGPQVVTTQPASPWGMPGGYWVVQR